MEHKFQLGSFHRENRTTFVPLFPEMFQWDEPKSRVPFTSQPKLQEFFGKWKTSLVGIVSSSKVGFVSHWKSCRAGD